MRSRGVTRRTVLGSAAASTAVLTSGCLQRARNVLNRESGDQISLTIKTVPADQDRLSTELARSLAENLRAVGIDSEVVLMREDELRRDILINHAFDLYIARYPDRYDPDFLRPLLHSRFNGEPGWQNPFGFTNLGIDELLTEQRRHEGSDRRSLLFDILRDYTRQQPFTVIGFPDEIRAARSDRFEGWSDFPPRDPINLIRIRKSANAQAEADEEDGSLRLTIVDDRATKNLNPLAVEFRNEGLFTALLYDSLGRRFDDAVRPWLAEDWEWTTGTDGTEATVRLREDLNWHDGNPLTATDVAFTYRLLEDTTLGARDSPVPAPRFRGRISLVEAVEPLETRRLRFDFGDASPEVAVRAFTVPQLPRHEWEPKAEKVNLAGLDLFDGVTEALVWQNPEPVGSGVVEFNRRIPEELLVLKRYDDHFLHRDTDSPLSTRFDGGLAFGQLNARVAPSDEAAVELIAAGEADATASSNDPSVVPRIGRYDDLQLLTDPSRSFYHVGFNERRGPLSNQRFRRAVARLIDKSWIADDLFAGFLEATTSPLPDGYWTPSDLRWEGEDPEVPFVGSEGELDVETARSLFRDAGYEYNDQGELITR